MAIYVRDAVTQHKFEDATGWHVDEEGFLHVRTKDSGHVATFAPGGWTFVLRMPA